MEKTMEKEKEKDLDEMVGEELREKVISLTENMEKLKRHYTDLLGYTERVRLALGKALEPMIFFQLSPWVNQDRYLNETDKKAILLHLAKVVRPLSVILAPNNPVKQLQTLVNQCYSSFVEAYGLVDIGSKIKYAGESYVVKDSNGLKPYVLQTTGKGKSNLHKKPLADFLKVVEAERKLSSETEPAQEGPIKAAVDTDED